MIGILEAIGAALLWGTSMAASARSSRALGASVALAWVMVVGLVFVTPLALLSGSPQTGAAGWAWVLVATAGSVAGLALMYGAVRNGPLSLVSPLSAVQGAVAAVLAVLDGQELRLLSAIALAAIVIGMLAVTVPIATPGGAAAAPHPTRAIVLATASAVAFGVSLFAGARGGDAVGTPWLLFVVRLVGASCLILPLLTTRRLTSPRRVWPYLVYSGIADVSAFGLYVIAARRIGVAVPAVVASQFAVVSSLLGVVVFGERLSGRQFGGIATILVGVAVVTAVQA